MKKSRAMHRLPPVACPGCFSKLDAASSLDGDSPPVTGDFTVCLCCSALLRYGPDMELEVTSLAECPIQLRASLARVKMLTEEFRVFEKRSKPWAM
jgi:hypothetical protein